MRKQDWDWDRLRGRVLRDMHVAGYATQQQLADAMPSFTLRALSDFLTGKSTLRDSNLAKLEFALGWEPGSARDALRGGEPRYFSTTGGQATETGAARGSVILHATFDELIWIREAVVEVFGAIEGEEFMRRALQVRADLSDAQEKATNGTSTPQP